MIKMDELHNSVINHWKRIKMGKDLGFGSDQCAYCQEFMDDFDGSCDIRCPIKSKTGVECKYGPWGEFFLHVTDIHGVERLMLKKGTVKKCKECQKLVNKMIKFLKSIKEEDKANV